MGMEIAERQSDSPYVERVWRSRTAGVSRMTSIATSHKELVVWEHEGSLHVSMRGPETVATSADVPDGSDSFGIVFGHGASMPHLAMARLVDADLESPHVSRGAFVLRGEEWEVPTYDNAEVFIDRLVRDGVLVRDPLVDEVVAGDAAPLGARSIQRRVAAATGLTQGAIRQIERARQAALLLREGTTALEVVHRLGYYDQPHLARSLTRFVGRTATQLRRSDTPEPLSLLYKTDGLRGS
ncbi:helix-turn-helix domain-containing protein [Mumia sp. DW29H23]|uniref:AraC family transcriptional regulator n=1 Tax=Mumia sp. DW29H23 TaxID=3421241 RepID=UPI003D6819E4